MAGEVSIIGIATIGTIIGVSYILSFIFISNFVGSSDYWNQIQDRRDRIWIMSMVGSLTLFAAAFIYFIVGRNHEKIMYFIFPVTFLAMGLAFSALGVALIHRKKE